MPVSSDNNQLNIRVAVELKRAFIEKAKADGTNATELIVEFMRRYLGWDSEDLANHLAIAVRLTDIETLLAFMQQYLGLESQDLGKNPPLTSRFAEIETRLTEIEACLSTPNLQVSRQSHYTHTSHQIRH